MQFQAELEKESSPFFCINCHIPLQNQQEYIVDGYINGDLYNPSRRKNPGFNYSLQQEGITCAACHVRDNAIIGPTGAPNAPHKTIKNPEHLSESLCISCHNAVAVITPDLACIFETGDEWKAGPYFGKKNCISCHMSEVQRSLVDGLPEKRSHFHSFKGSGIPKHESLVVEMLKSLTFNWEDVRTSFTQGAISLNLVVKNEHAGHRVPTGDPERFILINMKLYNSESIMLREETFRIGEKWKWYPEAKKLSDNNLNPGESRVYTLRTNKLKPGNSYVKLEVTKHRMTAKTAEHNGLDDSYPRSVMMQVDEVEFVVK